MDRPPFQFNEDICKDPKKLAERLNKIMEELFRTKQERDDFKKGA